MQLKRHLVRLLLVSSMARVWRKDKTNRVTAQFVIDGNRKWEAA